jgi:hypothetical protein
VPAANGGNPVNPSAQPRSPVRYATQFLGLNTNTSVLLLAIVLIAAGKETWMHFVPKYLEILGASAFIIGAHDGLKTLLGAVYAWPGGIAVDRWGHRTALMSFTEFRSQGTCSSLLFRIWLQLSLAHSSFLPGRRCLCQRLLRW